MTPKQDKSDSDLLREIHECLCGTFERRGLIRRVEILEWWKKIVTSTLLWISGTGIVGVVTWFFTNKMVGR